jgi:hypothetical protein
VSLKPLNAIWGTLPFLSPKYIISAQVLKRTILPIVNTKMTNKIHREMDANTIKPEISSSVLIRLAKMKKIIIRIPAKPEELRNHANLTIAHWFNLSMSNLQKTPLFHWWRAIIKMGTDQVIIKVA